MSPQSLARWGSRTRHDLRLLRNEPLLGVGVAAIFALLLLFIAYPLVRVFLVSFFPDGVPTLRLYREFLGSWFIQQAFLNSVMMGILTALGGCLVGFLFAFTLTRTDIPCKSFFTVAAILPVISPPFVSALSIILLFGNNGLITRQLLGLQDFAIYGLRGLLLTRTDDDRRCLRCSSGEILRPERGQGKEDLFRTRAGREADWRVCAWCRL